MSTLWEEKPMRKCLSIIFYEYKMQMKRLATWGVLIAATIVALLDSFPSAGNFARLEFLVDPAYFIYRTISLDGLVIIFGLMFLLSSRIPLDLKTGVKPLFMASPISKHIYISGKLLSGFLYTFTVLGLFLTANTLIYALATPFDVSVVSCIVPLIKTILICAVPISIFISFVSAALPAVIDVRLFYLLASVLFIINAATVGSATQMPFYLITSGDLVKLIWQHPKYPFIDISSVYANLIFLIGCGLLAWIFLHFKRRFWRADK